MKYPLKIDIVPEKKYTSCYNITETITYMYTVMLSLALGPWQNVIEIIL